MYLHLTPTLKIGRSTYISFHQHQKFNITSLPNGAKDKPAILKCCLANGIPIIVIKSKHPKITWTNHAQSPPHSNQMRFKGIRIHPVGDSILLTSDPKGHKHNKPILKVCKAMGIPIMVIANAKLPVKYP